MSTPVAGAERTAEELVRGILDSLPQHIALLDRDGVILAVNEPWRRFARQGGARPEAVLEGANYLAACRAAAETGDATAREALAGLTKLFSGACDAFTFEYPCATPERELWFEMHASRAAFGVSKFVVSHADVTTRKNAEEALRESERRERRHAAELEAILDTVPIGVSIALDPRGDHMRGNRACEELLGTTPGAELSMTAPDAPALRVFRQGRKLSVDELPLQRALAGELVSDILEIVRPDGRTVTVYAKAAPLHYENGETNGAVGAFLDITSLKRAEEALRESEERHRTLIEALGDGVFVAQDYRFVFANAALPAMLGYTPAEFWDMPFDKVIAPECLPLWNERFAQRIGDGPEPPGNYEARAVPKSGGPPIDMELRARRIQYRGRPAVLGVLRDVTERKKTEQALIAADRRKDEFLATLAHELRNPLAPIHDAAHVLRRMSLTGPDGENSRALVEIIDRQVGHLIRLVDELLEVSRITRGKIELMIERIDLAAVIRQAVETSRPVIDRGGHALRVELPDAPLPLDADPVRMTQVFTNLLNNAAKYTEPGGEIVVRADRRGREAVITVTDSGLGIPPEMLPRVFDLFTQVHRTLGRAQGGLGIGLALVRSLLKLQGGSVEAESAGLGRGTTFTIRLPLAATAGTQEAQPPENSGAARCSRRILVVDDDVDVARSFAILLETYGAVVRTENSGAAGVAAFDAFRPDLVFLDIGMPRMDGYETARRLRARPGGEKATLVALTGWGEKQISEQVRAAGFDFHLTKPAPDAELEKLLFAGARTSGAVEGV